MSTVVASEARINHAKVTRSEIVAYLTDGRVIRVPLAWSWRLSEATPAQRANFRLIGAGYGIHWPDVDEDISVAGMLHGSPAPRPSGGSTIKARAGSEVSQPLQRAGSASR